MSKIILITGASSGFGALSARALADAGHTVYASMRETTGRNAPAVEDAAAYAREHAVDLRTVELDIASQASVDTGVAQVVRDAGGLDVLVHNAGHMVLGPAEAFTPEQFASVYDTNVLSTQRVNRAALPHLRRAVDARGEALLVWVSSTSVRGGTPPLLAPYFAAKAAMDSLAVSYAAELARASIETSIVVPGAFTTGTNHFANAGKPDDAERAALYAAGPYEGFADGVQKALAAASPPDADVADVARAIVDVVGAPFGTRPFRVHVDPAQDGSDVVSAVADRVRAEFLRRLGLKDLLAPRTPDATA